MESRKRGEITAFLSIIIFLILAVVGTVIESARVRTARFYTERSLRTAVDSIFTEYCKPLYDNYHLFFLEEDNVLGINNGIGVEDKVKDYMQYTLQPETNLLLPNYNLYNIYTENVEVKDFVKAMDEDNKLFSSQVEAYMKYRANGEILNQIIKQIKIFKQSNDVVTLLKEEQKVEEKLVEFDKKTVELVELIEGISFGKNGIEYTTGGLIKTRPSFAKQVVCSIGGRESVGVHHDLVWESMKNKYYDIGNNIKELERELLKLEEVSDVKRRKKILNIINKDKNQMLEQINITEKKIDESLILLDQLSMKRKELKTYTEEYKMKSHLGERENVSKGRSIISSFSRLKDVLESNRNILKRVKELEGVSVEQLTGEIQSIKKVLVHYDVRSLQFDYSSLVAKGQTPNPIEEVKKLIKEGMCGLVLEDPKDLSSKQLICQNYKTNKEKITNNLGGIDSEEEVKTISILELFNVMCSGNDSLGKETEGVLGKVLMEEYVKEHFKSYLEQSEITRETALDYEKEYLIAGKKMDRENMLQVIEQLVIVRVIYNLLYLFTDKSKGEMAYLTAVALVGFTCLEPLVRATQILILTFWSIVEAIIEVGALLKGKELPLLKNQNNFMISYPELLCVNRKFIQKKIQEVPVGNKSGISLDYKDYLSLFVILLNKSNRDIRMINLIEENMKLIYREEFSMEEAIAGMTISASWKVPTKFIDLNYINKMLRQKTGYWYIESTVGNVY